MLWRKTKPRRGLWEGCGGEFISRVFETGLTEKEQLSQDLHAMRELSVAGETLVLDLWKYSSSLWRDFSRRAGCLNGSRGERRRSW